MLLGLRSYLKTTVVGPLLGGLLTAAAGALASAPAAAVELQPFTLATPFPANFLYGTAVAGFQVEMGCPTTAPEVCEDRHSDWYAFITSPWTLFDPLLHLTTDAPSAGPGFYESYPSDLRLAKDALASNAVRVSVEWSRIFPTPTFGVNGYEALKAQASPQALAYYHAQFAAIRALGMEPFVTLNHYTLPTWIHDAVGCHYSLLLCSPKGWADPDMIVPEIAKYAGFVAHEFGPEVDYWATLNGPFASIVFAGYLFPSEIRSNPPGLLLNFPAAKIAMRAMVYAHARMVDAVRAEDRWSAKPGTAPATVGLIASNLVIEAVSGKDQDRQAADGLRYLVNDLFLTAVADGDLDEDWTRQPVHHEDLAGRLDFIGLNYYSRIQIGAAPESAEQAKAAASPLVTFDLQQFAAQQQPQAPFSDFSPEALFQLIADTAKYHRPIYITETGYDAGEDSTLASNWLIQSLDATRRALAAGYDVRGYFYWSLLDNFEWNKGYKPRFGLYGVEPTDPAKKRTPRPAAALFHQFGDTRLLPAVVPATD